MKYRTIPGTRLSVSEIGFGLSSLCKETGCNIPDAKVQHLIRYALDRGINFFDTADTDGGGHAESLIGNALVDERERVVISTKVGYDMLQQTPGMRGEELPQNFTPKYVRTACIESLRRLRTDRIDLYQIYHPKISTVERDDLYACIEKLRKEGKIVSWGAVLGPGEGWVEEAKLLMRLRKAKNFQAIFNLIEQDSAKQLIDAAKKNNAGIFARAPEACGWFSRSRCENKKGPWADHSAENFATRFARAEEKVSQFEFLKQYGVRTLAQAALKFVLSEKTVISAFPEIYGEDEINEFAKVSECPDLTAEELSKITDLFEHEFYLAPKVKAAAMKK